MQKYDNHISKTEGGRVKRCAAGQKGPCGATFLIVMVGPLGGTKGRPSPVSGEHQWRKKKKRTKKILGEGNELSFQAL